MLNRLLEDPFEGKLTSSKWAKMTQCSQDTALVDKALRLLIQINIYWINVAFKQHRIDFDDPEQVVLN